MAKWLSWAQMRSLAESETGPLFCIYFQVYPSLEFANFVKASWKLTKLKHSKPYLFKHSVPTGWKSVPHKWLVLGIKWLAELLLVLSSWLTHPPKAELTQVCVSAHSANTLPFSFCSKLLGKGGCFFIGYLKPWWLYFSFHKRMEGVEIRHCL